MFLLIYYSVVFVNLCTQDFQCVNIISFIHLCYIYFSRLFNFWTVYFSSVYL